jgi:hypothetical protein
VPAIHWVNRPTFQQVVQVGVDVPISRAFGAGSLQAPGNKKIGFAFDVQSLVGGGADGRFYLRDFGAKRSIEVQEISSAGSPAGSGCGTIPSGGANTFEFTGSGRFDGAGSHSVHVCAQDNSSGPDRLHVDCATCPYNTITSAMSETLTGGNIVVRGADSSPPPPGQPQVVVLDPVLGAIGGLGVPLTMTATAYDSTGNPVPGAALSLLSSSGLLSITPLAQLTDADGRLVYRVLGLPGLDVEVSALAGNLASNPVRVSWK